MIYPNYDVFLENRTVYTSIPIYTKFKEDFFTPIAIFQKLKKLNPKFLLESAGEHQENGRYSYIGVDSMNISSQFSNLKDIENHIKTINALQDSKLPPFYNGFIGYLSYESIGDIHPITIKKNADIPSY